ncbi:hypothetical protein OEZ85_013092 [Tetradesmus obliquus]|uniref:Very-long-chain (3R)-3-hydroxyacyl-CoA dehydratase n=1 Tax=Tetradesmus obliquus TaxID=3088 RepID=A0ABY8U5B3_TETOB|nr:hypothetical protein OEZ85_013092 [Tetradesmus obliquus]
MTKHREHNNAHPAIRGYLVLYNAVQGIGWSLCLAACLSAAHKGPDRQSIFLAGSVYARWLQFAAFAEILHAGTGIVPSSPVTNFLQWLGRANALFMFAVGIPELQHLSCAPLMLIVWSLGEMIRYPWYGLQLLHACPAWLTWLRYNAFLLLYPTGVVSEMLLLWKGLPYLRSRDLYSIHMPNKYNFAWDYAIFIQIMLVLYPYLWWGNFSSLLRQRSKKLKAPVAAGGQRAAAAGKED